MTFYLSSLIGLVLFIAIMVLARKKKLSLALYITACLASAACITNLIIPLYGHYFGAFNLYFYILTTLVVGLLIDCIIQKTVKE